MSRRAEAIFISDLHLCAEEPATTQAFLDFIARSVLGRTERLYILGDLFEYWAGDDDLDDAFNQTIVATLQQISASGIALFFIAGNRDFLIGAEWAHATGAMLLPDPFLTEFTAGHFLLSHGDVLCTDDTDYQAFRALVREPAWQAAFLARPLAERHALISGMRMQSEQAKQYKQAGIMDVNADAVAELLRRFPGSTLIHGHTHRPAHHHLTLDGIARQRWVLTDWHVAPSGPKRGGGLLLNEAGLRVLSATP